MIDGEELPRIQADEIASLSSAIVEAYAISDTGTTT